MLCSVGTTNRVALIRSLLLECALPGIDKYSYGGDVEEPSSVGKEFMLYYCVRKTA